MNQQELITVNRDLAGLAAELQNNQAIARANGQPVPAGTEVQFDPSGLYARAIHVLKAPDAGKHASADDIAYSIRFLAAKLRAGDIDFVLESLVGQASWLQAAATALALELGSMKTARDKKALGELILRFQSTATRTLEALAEIAAARAPRTFG